MVKRKVKKSDRVIVTTKSGRTFKGVLPPQVNIKARTAKEARVIFLKRFPSYRVYDVTQNYKGSYRVTGIRR